MPAYSFQPRFVPYVKEGSKPHTIRDRRRYPAKVGDPVYLYTGMRTKWCQKIGEDTCKRTFSIAIYLYGIVFYDRLLDKVELEAAKKNPFDELLPVDRLLPIEECERLAWLDGFRPDFATKENPSGAFADMIRYWQQTRALPWAGDIIYWK